MDLETELRRERRIELAGEGTRYADVMRWREGELRFGRAITGPSLKVCMNDLGANPYPDTGVDELVMLSTKNLPRKAARVTSNATKHYLWPVPNPERQKNPLLGQNPAGKSNH